MKILATKKYSILKTILKYSFVFVFAFSFISMQAIAADSVSGNIIQTGINNPLGEGHLEDIPSFIEALLNIVLVVGIPIVALAIIYSGFLFVKAQGNPEELKKAKDTLMYTIIGAALLLGSFVLASAIGNTVEEIKSTT